MTYKIGSTITIIAADENKGKIGTIERIFKDGLSVYINGDEDVKFFEFSEVASSVCDRQSLDISSGLGIGGIGSDDYNINTERDYPSAYRPHKCGRGQRYDERCTGCGRITVICNDCELCERCHGD